MREPTDRPDRDAVWADMLRRHAGYAVDHPGTADLPDHRPQAAILACSDARVPPSIIFGQEPGSLFVVRLAGNSATPSAVASLTYAVEQLGTDLVVVLGHTGCGAVTAALDARPDDAAADALSAILSPIDEMLASCDRCDEPDAAVAANVRHNVARLARDRGPLGRAIANGSVTVRGAVHDLRTGRLLDATDRHPLTTPQPVRSTR
jgi:carbonic anhydrase